MTLCIPPKVPKIIPNPKTRMTSVNSGVLNHVEKKGAKIKVNEYTKLAKMVCAQKIVLKSTSSASFFCINAVPKPQFIKIPNNTVNIPANATTP